MADMKLNPGVFALSPKDETATEFINQWVTASQRVREVHEPEWEENWANYRVEPYAQQDPRENIYDTRQRGGLMQLKTPESHQVVNTLTSTMMGSLFGVRDYVKADPVADSNVDEAQLVSKLIMYGLERPGGFRTDYETLKDALIFGTGLYRVGWRTDTRTVPRRVPIPDGQGGFVTDPETGVPITVLQNVPATVYDDVVRYPVSLYDAWFDPAASRLPDSLGLVRRDRISRDDLRSLREAPGWDAAAISEVLGSSPGGWPHGPGNDDSPKLTIEGLTREDIKDIEKFGFYGIWEYHGRLPSEVARKLGLEANACNILTLINGKLVRATQSPQRDGEIPYGTISILPTGATIYGLSPLTVIRYLQDVSDTQLILTTQAMIEAVYQNYVVGGGIGSGPGFKRALENRKPREVFVVPGDVSQVQPLAKDYQGLGIAAQGLQILSQTMRDATAARDPVQGIAAPGDTTATEVNTVAASALQNVDQLSRLVERDELPRLGRLVWGEYYTNLEDEGRVIQRVGEDTQTDIRFFDISGEFDVNFIGARLALTKAAKANQFREFLSIMLSNPLTAASLDIMEAVRRFGDEAMDVRGLESLVIQDPEEIVARLQAMNLGDPMKAQASKGASDDSSKNTPRQSR